MHNKPKSNRNAWIVAGVVILVNLLLLVTGQFDKMIDKIGEMMRFLE